MGSGPIYIQSRHGAPFLYLSAAYGRTQAAGPYPQSCHLIYGLIWLRVSHLILFHAITLDFVSSADIFPSWQAGPHAPGSYGA